MGDIDDIDGGLDFPEPLGEAVLAAGVLCLACGGAISGPYCASCGQKNDDLRRSSFVLAKDFFKDTFGFDSRMWRTLGMLAMAPGDVPKEYAHGRRSRFTPPVRLFIVVSFLFFLTIGFTDTLFVGVEIRFHDEDAAKEGSAVALSAGETDKCSFQGSLRFFVKEKDLSTDKARFEECFGNVGVRAREEIAQAETVKVGKDEGREAELEQAAESIERVFTGISWVIGNPRAFNDAFNDWLPRVLFFMTPVLAVILALFLRRGALLFDHLVLSFYSHAVSFAVIGTSLILTQLGAPYMGFAAFLVIAAYYIAALKRAYGRGWIKTLWSASMSAALYILVFLTILLTITSNIVWTASA
jgi:hypothetical protein